MHSPNSFAAEPVCEANDAIVTSIFTWEDGTTFVTLSKDNNCGCPIASRFGILPNAPNGKTYIAQAMLAMAMNSKVRVYGATGCTAHGNSAALYSIIVNNANQ
jgi:hypothetical protein